MSESYFHAAESMAMPPLVVALDEVADALVVLDAPDEPSVEEDDWVCPPQPTSPAVAAIKPVTPMLPINPRRDTVFVLIASPFPACSVRIMVVSKPENDLKASSMLVNGLEMIQNPRDAKPLLDLSLLLICIIYIARNDSKPMPLLNHCMQCK